MEELTTSETCPIHGQTLVAATRPVPIHDTTGRPLEAGVGLDAVWACPVEFCDVWQSRSN